MCKLIFTSAELFNGIGVVDNDLYMCPLVRMNAHHSLAYFLASSNIQQINGDSGWIRIPMQIKRNSEHFGINIVLDIKILVPLLSTSMPIVKQIPHHFGKIALDYYGIRLKTNYVSLHINP